MKISHFLFLIVLTINPIHTFYFSLQQGAQECFVLSVVSRSVVTLDYHILDKLESSNGEKIKIELKVTGIQSGKLIQQETLVGNKEGEVEIFYEGSPDFMQMCFTTDSYHWFSENKRIRIEIDYQMITAQDKADDESFAKMEDLQPIYELNQDIDQGIHLIQSQVDSHYQTTQQLMDELAYTNDSISLIATFQVVLLVVLAILQLVYLRRFIARKNL